MSPSKDKKEVYLPRTEEHCHIVVNQEMHFAIKQYAAKHGISLASAAANLIQQGFLYEINELNIAESRQRTKKLVNEIVRKELKERNGNVQG